MKTACPYCQARVVQARNCGGLNFCLACEKLFLAPPERPLPPWILGVLVFLVAHWQIISQ
jgi:hypothetical protein